MTNEQKFISLPTRQKAEVVYDLMAKIDYQGMCDGCPAKKICDTAEFDFCKALGDREYCVRVIEILFNEECWDE